MWCIDCRKWGSWIVGVRNGCRCITGSSLGSHGRVTATAQPRERWSDCRVLAQEKIEVQSTVPLKAYCFCTIEKLKNCKLSHRINLGPSAYKLRKIQRRWWFYCPGVKIVTILMYLLLIIIFCACVCFLLQLQSWGWIEHTVFFLYTIFVFIPLHLQRAAALHLYM